MKKRFSFTEALMIVCLLLILIALFIPIFKRAKYKSRLISCSNNLQENGIALFAYSKDHNDYFPYRQAIDHGKRLKATKLKSGDFDDRLSLASYLNLNTHFRDPFSESNTFDFQTSDADKIESSYGLWWSWGYEGQKRNLKSDQTWQYNETEFFVLMSDWEVSKGSNIESSHPDNSYEGEFRESKKHSHYQAWYKGLVNRDVMHKNFLMNDGRVDQLKLESAENEGLIKVPAISGSLSSRLETFLPEGE